VRDLLVIEDGTEYEDFAKVFLSDAFVVRAAHNAAEALAAVRESKPDALLVDLRFDRAVEGDLTGDLDRAAADRFGGDRGRALRWLKEQQGAFILGLLREAGVEAPALFVHDFPPRRLENLRRLYGRVDAVETFDASAIRAALGRSR
jgi:CheY-like chemotaxis protein